MHSDVLMDEFFIKPKMNIKTNSALNTRKKIEKSKYVTERLIIFITINDKQRYTLEMQNTS